MGHRGSNLGPRGYESDPDKFKHFETRYNILFLKVYLTSLNNSSVFKSVLKSLILFRVVPYAVPF